MEIIDQTILHNKLCIFTNLCHLFISKENGIKALLAKTRIGFLPRKMEYMMGNGYPAADTGGQ